MASLILDYLSQIIGIRRQEEQSIKVIFALDHILASIQQEVTNNEAKILERSSVAKECKLALFALGLEKFVGWDRIIGEFMKEFWEELSEPIIKIANRSFLEGKMEECVMKGLVKPAPNHVSYYLPK